MSKCINCERRRCLLIQACAWDPPGWEVAESITICRACLRDDFGSLTLASYFAKYAR